MKKVARQVDTERRVRLALNQSDIERGKVVGGEICTFDRVLKNETKYSEAIVMDDAHR